MYLTLIGIFAAIYHPVGIAMVVQNREKTGVVIAINGIFGNLGVASAALFTGILIDALSWRGAFMVPGVISIAVGLLYLWFICTHLVESSACEPARPSGPGPLSRSNLTRTFIIIFFTTAVGGLIFQCTSFALPKVFEEQLIEFASSASSLGVYTFLVFALAAFAQLLVGYLVDHYSIRVVFSAVALLQAICFALMMNSTGIMALLIAVAFMLVVFGQIPINDVLVGRITRSAWRSRAYALRYIVTFSIMASAIPLIAWIHSDWGFSVLFGVVSGASALIFIAVLFLPRLSGEATTPNS